MTYNIERGSEWGKWDLHVHTPYSYLSNNFGSNFDEYVKRLFKSALENNVVAIGITDYFCIEGYKKIREEYLNDPVKLATLFSQEEISKIGNILLLPNIEFRLNKLVGPNRTNFHVIFSDKVSIQDIEENFLHDLDFTYEGTPQGEDESSKLKIHNLKVLGRKLKSEHKNFDSDDDLFVGMKCAVVDDGQIVSKLIQKKSKFEGKYLLFTPVDEDLSSLSWDGQDHNVRKVLIQKSDGFFASNKNTINWGLGILTGEEEFIAEFKTLKPSIWGSDAHNFENLFKPNNDKFCWIKANPTFEGLKQITYEPSERVRIDPKNPDSERNSWNLVSLQISNSNNPLLVDQEILFNSRLVSLIGGRGTGKTALLSLINFLNGKPDDFIEWVLKLGDADITSKFINKDGDEKIFISKLSEPINHSLPIYYLSQEKINKFSEFYDKEDVRNMFMEKLDIDSYISFDSISKRAYDLISRLQDLDRSVADTISFRQSESKVKNIVFTNVDDYLRTLENQLSSLKEKYSNSKTEGVLKEISKITLHAEVLKGIKNSEKLAQIEITIGNLDKLILEFKELLRQHDDSGNVYIDIEDANLIPNYDLSIFQKSKEKIISKIDSKLDGLRTSYVEKMDELSALGIKDPKSITNAIKQIEQDLDKIRTDRRNLFALNIERNNVQNLLVDLFNGYNEEILRLRSLIESQFQEFMLNRDPLFYSIFEGIEVSSGVYFDKKMFLESFKQNLYSGNIEFFDSDLNNLSDNSEISFFSTFCLDVLKKISANKDKFKKDNDGYYSVLKLIFGDCMNYIKVQPRIQLGDRELGSMSGGQQATLLLKLHIASEGLSNDIIILDQPENHLDNKFIIENLINLIKQLKAEKQVIIASHNANIVVGSDSEEVIIARMDEDNKLYLSGSLENPLIKNLVILTLEGGEKAFSKRNKKYNF